MHRQQLELRGAIAQDEIFQSHFNPNHCPNPRLTFRHIEIFHTAKMFDRFVKEMIDNAESDIPKGGDYNVESVAVDVERVESSMKPLSSSIDIAINV